MVLESILAAEDGGLSRASSGWALWLGSSSYNIVQRLGCQLDVRLCDLLAGSACNSSNGGQNHSEVCMVLGYFLGAEELWLDPLAGLLCRYRGIRAILVCFHHGSACCSSHESH